MKNRLLNEHVTRRMMSLAGIKALSKDFISESVYEGDLDENEELEEQEEEVEDEEADLEAEAGDELPAPDMAPEEEPAPEVDPAGELEPEMDMGPEGDVSADDLGEFLADLTAWIDDYAEEKGIDFDADVEMEDEAPEGPEGMDMPPEPDAEEEMGPEELEESDIYVEDVDLEEELVNEVTRRVAHRILNASRKTRR